MAGLNLPARHSPGLRRREATRDSTETRRESNCGVREVSCFFPLQRGLHALCQCGASGETRALGKFLIGSKARRNSTKAYALSTLPPFASRDGRIRWNISVPVLMTQRYEFRAEMGQRSGKRNSIWVKLRFHSPLFRVTAHR